ISHRKALPHVIYCRVYRWPDLQSHHELKAIDDCRYCYESGQKDICINPYHYERVESAGILPPVLVPRYTEPSPNVIPRMLRMSSLLYDTNSQSSQSTMPLNIDCSNINNFIINHNVQKQENDEQMSANNNVTDLAAAAPLNTLPQNIPTYEVGYQEGKYWATISYFELNTRVGEQFKVSSPTVQIDGFTDPTSNPNKICLGLLSNVNRNQQIESTRRHIGKGVKLTYVPHQGTLFAECQSESAIFIQSRNCNYFHNFHPTTVCKITNGISLKIFDMSKFRELLAESAQYRSFDASYELTKMTIIRMSFVKGWGSEYQRQDITSTPCWIEIHLHTPLSTYVFGEKYDEYSRTLSIQFQWLDETLLRMGPPPNPISSIS
ncbi:unnamed protein product, partial [Anisakis simplex]|uniref:Mothers against decapentaplegic homolog n=1 Tax=Anisakis simplex TaxID=6269 RepID=A0A0M3J077_ANISI